MKKTTDISIFIMLFNIFKGIFIGIGAVLPGISGGVLCVIFGIYQTVMEFLAAPFKRITTHLPKLIPYGVGAVIGFLGVSKLLSFLLDKYPAPSVCIFIGLIIGMLPSLFKEAKMKGSSKAADVALYIAMTVIFLLLVTLDVLAINITPNFAWYIFCGFCLALSVIAPGMSFSTLLMPLGLYEPFIAGISELNMEILLPAFIGAIITIVVFAKAINMLFERHYAIVFHAIIGVVISATVVIVPFSSFLESVASAIINIICILCGIFVACLFDK